MQIHIHRDGQQYGPYSLQDITKHVRDGTLTPEDLAFYEGAADWMPLNQVPGISLPTAHPAPPPPPSIHAKTATTQSRHKTVKEAYGSMKGLGLFDLIPGIRDLPYPVRLILAVIAVALIVIFVLPRIF